MGGGHHTFAAEIGTWLDSNRLDLQGQQVGGGHHTFAAEIGTWLDSNRLDLQGQQGEIAT